MSYAFGSKYCTPNPASHGATKRVALITSDGVKKPFSSVKAAEEFLGLEINAGKLSTIIRKHKTINGYTPKYL